MIAPGFAFPAWLLLALALYLFRLAYIGWIGRYMLAFALILPPLLTLFSLPSMLALRLSLSAPESCPMGGEAAFSLRFETGRLLPLRRVKVWLELENVFTGQRQSFCYLFRGVASQTARLPLPTDACGLLRCRVLRYSCCDLLGLFTLRRRGGPAAACVVLPVPAEPEKLPDLEEILSAAVRLQPKPGGGFSEEHELREYRPGDPSNSIHWKLSSKTGGLIVREAMENACRDIYLAPLSPAGDGKVLSLAYALSLRLCAMELPHILVGASLWEIANETQAREALCSYLSCPACPPCPFDASRARCVFTVNGEEVRSG